MNQKIAIVGLGLIGGSLARAFRNYTGCAVVGFDRDPRVLEAALACGAIEASGTEENLREADLLFLCLYPRAAVAFLEEHLASLRPGCIVTDTCGIKSAVAPRLAELAKEHGLVYVGGHPMAGREKSGFEASDADLFQGASYILVPCGAPLEAVETMKEAALALGCSGTVETTPEEHDRMIAFTSQIPHVLASAYVKSPCCPKHRGFSAGSYRDVSRVASINETMWAELFLENRSALLEELDGLLARTSEIRDAIARNDEEGLRALLRESRRIKEKLGE